jgi:hypothetical protein
MKRRLAGCLAFWCCATWHIHAANPLLSLRSPDGAVEFRLLGLSGQPLHYDVKFRRQNVIQTSLMNFSVDRADLTKSSERSDSLKIDLAAGGGFVARFNK